MISPVDAAGKSAGGRKKNTKRWSHAVASGSSAGGMIQSRPDDSLSCFLAAVEPATYRFAARADVRKALLPNGEAAEAVCSQGLWEFLRAAFAAAALPVRFDERG